LSWMYSLTAWSMVIAVLANASENKLWGRPLYRSPGAAGPEQV
jgi:hypothetical protein